MSAKTVPYRAPGTPSFGVSLYYSDDGQKVVARSHFPYVWVNTECLHYGQYTPREASDVANEYLEYYCGMTATIDRIDQAIAMLQEQKAYLIAQLETGVLPQNE